MSKKEAFQKQQYFSNKEEALTGQGLKMNSAEPLRNKARLKSSTFSLERFNCQITRNWANQFDL